jgi:hypothetical protein
MLTTVDAYETIKRWREHFAAQPGQPICMIWDASEMAGYQSDARKLWQSAMKEMKGQIGTIWLITQSPIIRMGARMMSTFSSLDIMVVRSENEISM